MTMQYLGQIRPFSFNFAPKGWAQCNGTILPIQQNQALFSLLGTTYGGNGVTNFALPDLRSRVPVHYGNYAGQSYVLGEPGGVESVLLNSTQLPMHNHIFAVQASGTANVRNPVSGGALTSATLPSGTPNNFYGPMNTLQPLAAASVGQAGGNTAHTNIQPYLAVNWCIALQGVFPSRN
jgi:Microcystin-dependent protein